MIISNIINFVDVAIETLQDRRKRVMLVALGLGNITACNAAGPYNNSSTPYVQLSSLVITDTSNTIQAPAMLKPTENNGSFTIRWQQSGNRSYTSTVYLSLDALPDSVSATTPAVKDIALFTLDVTDPNATLGSVNNPSSTKTCTYATDNTIDCGTKVDVQPMLTTLPKSAYIVVQSCLVQDKTCVHASYAIVLQ